MENSSERGAGRSAPIIRPIRWPDDASPLEALDTSFSTDRVYRVNRGPFSFELVEEVVDPPRRRRACSPPLGDQADRLRGMGHAVVAVEDGVVVGVVAADLSTWNRRVQVEHFYVTAGARGRGIGRALMGSVVAFARDAGAHCVWLETQDVNHPAVQFYRRLGFRLCGFDQRFYDPASPAGKDTALFFALDLAA